MQFIPPSVSALDSRPPAGTSEVEYSELFGETELEGGLHEQDRYTTEWEIPAESEKHHSQDEEGEFGS